MLGCELRPEADQEASDAIGQSRAEPVALLKRHSSRRTRALVGNFPFVGSHARSSIAGGKTLPWGPARVNFGAGFPLGQTTALISQDPRR
ncbi:hypothetical protein SAMN05414139_10261 [Burkholderia sp. D7]|nr:hypothetical protein SAMN05414139_10261 [Burkholderia sp. D7]